MQNRYNNNVYYWQNFCLHLKSFYTWNAMQITIAIIIPHIYFHIWSCNFYFHINCDTLVLGRSNLWKIFKSFSINPWADALVSGGTPHTPKKVVGLISGHAWASHINVSLPCLLSVSLSLPTLFSLSTIFLSLNIASGEDQKNKKVFSIKLWYILTWK